ncbi:MAG: holo-ACP synthase [Deltaproteobacteria bacterium]|nr:holo-ACP synthase [Deltaproteobacteria bacterium]
MILGVGNDLVSIARMARIHERHGERFERRVLGEAERADLAEGEGRAADLALRFAAKEAILKSLGAGLFRFSLQEMEVRRAPDGRYSVVTHGELRAEFLRRGVRAMHLDATTAGDMAAALAVAEGGPERRRSWL